MNVKDYFAVQSCLYCVDKLNSYADVSVGDNFISSKSDSRENGKVLNVREGSNTVILRTEKAQRCWESVKELFWWEECTMGQIEDSQKMKERRKNGVNLELLRGGGTSKAYSRALEKMQMGRQRQYELIHTEVEAKRKRQSNPVNRLMSGCKRIFRKFLAKG